MLPPLPRRPGNLAVSPEPTFLSNLMGPCVAPLGARSSHLNSARELTGASVWSMGPAFAIAVENKLHSRRDVTLREDACQVRKGHAPRTLAVLNSFVLAVFDWLGVVNVASQMRLFAARPFLALRLFMVPLENIK